MKAPAANKAAEHQKIEPLQGLNIQRHFSGGLSCPVLKFSLISVCRARRLLNRAPWLLSTAGIENRLLP